MAAGIGACALCSARQALWGALRPSASPRGHFRAASLLSGTPPAHSPHPLPGCRLFSTRLLVSWGGLTLWTACPPAGGWGLGVVSAPRSPPLSSGLPCARAIADSRFGCLFAPPRPPPPVFLSQGRALPPRCPVALARVLEGPPDTGSFIPLSQPTSKPIGATLAGVTCPAAAGPPPCCLLLGSVNLNSYSPSNLPISSAKASSVRGESTPRPTRGPP